VLEKTPSLAPRVAAAILSAKGARATDDFDTIGYSELELLSLLRGLGVLLLALLGAAWLATGLWKAVCPTSATTTSTSTQTDIHLEPGCDADRLLRGGEVYVTPSGERWHSRKDCQNHRMTRRSPCLVCSGAFGDAGR